MKNIIILLGLVLSFVSYSQNKTKTSTTKKDSVYIGKQVDDMSDKVYYYPSRSIVSIDEVNKQGFRLSSFIEGQKDDELYIKDLSLKMVGIGSCVEGNTLIIKFEDESKIELKSWNDFNCEGDAWFTIDEEQGNILGTKKIVKVKIQNGRSYESYTADIKSADSDFFIQLYQAIKNKKIKTQTK